MTPPPALSAERSPFIVCQWSFCLFSLPCVVRRPNPIVLMVSRHLSVYSATLYCERGYLTFPGATGQHSSLLRSPAEFTSLTLTAAGPTLGNRAHRLLLSFFFLFFFLRRCTWNNFIWRGWKYSRWEEKGTFVPWRNDPVGFFGPERCQNTFFSLVSQSELVMVKGLAALCVAPESFMTLAQSFPLILAFLCNLPLLPLLFFP